MTGSASSFWRLAAAVRRLSPLSVRRCVLCTSRSSTASAMVGSPMTADRPAETAAAQASHRRSRPGDAGRRGTLSRGLQRRPAEADRERNPPLAQPTDMLQPQDFRIGALSAGIGPPLGAKQRKPACRGSFPDTENTNPPQSGWPTSIRMGGRFAAGRLAPDSVAALDRIAESVAVSRSLAASTPYTAVSQQAPKLFARGRGILLREGRNPGATPSSCLNLVGALT